MFDTLCTYPLPSDLFTLAIHPTSPLLALGLASGHVQLNRLPPSPTTPTPPPPSKKKTPPAINTISTAWSTRRHKGSCRSLAFSQPRGTHLFSTGTDSLVKFADTETGRVTAKIAVPDLARNGAPDPPTLLHVFGPDCLLLATDSGALHLYDVREKKNAAAAASAAMMTMSTRPQQTYHPHADYVTSITSLRPPSSSSSSISSSATPGLSHGNIVTPTQFLSTGGTTVAITDIRRGILVQSEPQNEELLSSALCGDKVIVGGERGGLRIWEVGKWDDSEVEVDVARGGGGAGADVLAVLSGGGEDEEDEGEREGGMVVVGMDDGVVRFVDLEGRKGKGKVVGGEEVRHDEIEGVSELGFLNRDAAGRRMVSGGGSVVKIWGERVAVEGDESEEDEATAVNGQRGTSNHGDEDNDDNDDGSKSSADEDEEPKRKRKKRKRGKGKASDPKQVMKFKGLD